MDKIEKILNKLSFEEKKELKKFYYR